MQHIKLYENFTNNPIELNLTDKNLLDIDQLILTVFYDSEHWDSDEDYERDITYLATNENDSMADDLLHALYPYGLTIDFSQDHEYSLEDGWIDFRLKKISHAQLTGDEEGIAALKAQGYSDEDIEALKTASQYGIA